MASESTLKKSVRYNLVIPFKNSEFFKLIYSSAGAPFYAFTPKLTTAQNTHSEFINL